MTTTRNRLINTAERLFALYGLDGVSLDRIRREAGEKNASAMQYHFGSKQALLRAVFEARLAVIDRQRLAILAGVDPTDRGRALRGCVEALVRPFSEHLSRPGESRYYVRFVGQIYSDPKTEWSELLAGGRNEGVYQVGQMLAQLLPDLPRDIVKTRLELIVGLMIHGLADREKDMAANKRRRTHGTAAFVNLLIDMCVGALSAPHTNLSSPGSPRVSGLRVIPRVASSVSPIGN